MVSKFPLEFGTFLPTSHWVIRTQSTTDTVIDDVNVCRLNNFISGPDREISPVWISVSKRLLLNYMNFDLDICRAWSYLHVQGHRRRECC